MQNKKLEEEIKDITNIIIKPQENKQYKTDCKANRKVWYLML